MGIINTNARSHRIMVMMTAGCVEGKGKRAAADERNRADDLSFPCAACNLETDKALIAKVQQQKNEDFMTVREICEANNLRQGQVAWMLYVASPTKTTTSHNNHHESHAANENESSPTSPSILRRLRRLQRMIMSIT